MNIQETAQQITKTFNDNLNHYFSFFLLAFPMLLIYEAPPEMFKALGSGVMVVGILIQAMWFVALSVLLLGWLHTIAYQQRPTLTNIANGRALYVAFLLWLGHLIIFAPSNIISKFFLTLEQSTHSVILPFVMWNSLLSNIIYVALVYFVFRASPVLLLIATKQKFSLKESFQITENKEASIIWGFFHAAKYYALAWIGYKFLVAPLLMSILSGTNQTGNFIIEIIFTLPLTVFLTPLIISMFFVSLTVHYKDYLQKKS